MTVAFPTPEVVEKISNERILLIDVLRGFALFGIIINHITYSFLAGAPPAGNEEFNIFSSLDRYLGTASYVLTFGKFFSIFSFLFGLSFFIQLGSAKRKGKSFNLRFIWRLFILFIIGFIHNMFFSGDILLVYAILGLLLIPARHLGNRWLLALSIFLTLNTPSLIFDIINVNKPAPTQVEVQEQKKLMESFAKKSQEQYTIKQTGALLDVVKINAIEGVVFKFLFQLISGRLWVTLGLFLLGIYAGRRKIFTYNTTHFNFFKNLLTFTGIVALISTWFALKWGSPILGAKSIHQLIGNFSFNIQQAALSGFYVAAIVLLYWKTPAKEALQVLGPVGQMGLTTYLIQSVFGVILFYGFGFGMLGKLGITVSIVIGIIFFLIQILLSKQWLSRYYYGIVEWVWRSLTYLKIQPLKRKTQIADTI